MFSRLYGCFKPRFNGADDSGHTPGVKGKLAGKTTASGEAHCHSFPADYPVTAQIARYNALNNIEIIICLLLLFMAVPDVCRKLGRPALAFPAFVLFGLLLAPLANAPVTTLLQQAGQVGFLLLLFEVGLEIDLPPLREFARPLRRAAMWAILQSPIAFALAYFAGLDWLQSLVAAAALTACSVGMTHPAWKSYPGLAPEPKQFLLHVMVALEVMAIIVLAIETTALKSGWSWMVLLKLAGIVVTVYLIARFAAHLTNLFQNILERTTHWRIHLLVLLVLAICALGNGWDWTRPRPPSFSVWP